MKTQAEIDAGYEAWDKYVRMYRNLAWHERLMLALHVKDCVRPGESGDYQWQAPPPFPGAMFGFVTKE